MGKTKKQESSSSSDSSSDAKPVVKKTTTPSKVAAAPAKAKAPAKKKESSSSSSSEEVKKPMKEEKKPAPKAAEKKKAKKSSSSSDSSSSDSEDEKPKAKVNEKKRKADTAAEEPAAKKTKSETPAPAASAAAGGENRRVFLGNLPFTIDDDKIKEVMKDAGEITDIHWVTDRNTGKFYGTGFLEFSTPEGAQAAVAMNGADVLGRPIRVDFAQPKAEKGGEKKAFAPKGERVQRDATPKPEGCTTVFLGNLAFTIDEAGVRSAFADCGEITSVRWVERDGQFKGCGFVEFASSDATDKAVAKNGTDLLGRAVRVDYSAPKPKKF